MADNKGDPFKVDEARNIIRQLKVQGQTGFDQDQVAQAVFRDTGQFVMHPKLNPKYMRVSHDSKKYPRTTANLLFEDVTASQRDNPITTMQVFPDLMEKLFAGGWQTDPAWCMATFGDFRDPTIANVSLQVGQFELDQMITEWNRRFVLHGGGAGNGSESSEIALWMAGNHVELHNITKRSEDPSRKRGELVMVTDDNCLLSADQDIIRRIFVRIDENGKEVPYDIRRDVPIAKIIAAARKNFIITVLIPLSSENGRNPQIKRFWENLLGPDTVDGITLPNPVRYIEDTRQLAVIVPDVIQEHNRLLGTVNSK